MRHFLDFEKPIAELEGQIEALRHLSNGGDLNIADEVARLETAMWRSYYEKQQVRLFNQLAELLRKQYNMPLVRSNRVAYHAAKAAFIFKDGKQRSDYERALPNLVDFYRSVRDVSDTPFDVNRAARLELEWWIIHRERAKHFEEDLDRALAELQAEIYHVPVEKVMDHARLRAEAMRIRDTKRRPVESRKQTGRKSESYCANRGDLFRRWSDPELSSQSPITAA